jgi:hypothetical protein
MHSPEAAISVAISECIDWVKPKISKLEVRSQFNYSRSVIRRIRVRVQGIAAESKPGVLQGVIAKIRTSIRRRWPESWMIEGVQHLSLKGKTKPLCDWEVLGDRYIVVRIMGSIKPNSLADGTRSDIGRDIR